MDRLLIGSGSIVPEGFEVCDMGLELNRREGHSYWKPGEVMQFRGRVNGVLVWIERATGRMSWNGETRYRVAFGESPDYPWTVDEGEAVRLIEENVPSMGPVCVDCEVRDV